MARFFEVVRDALYASAAVCMGLMAWRVGMGEAAGFVFGVGMAKAVMGAEVASEAARRARA